jgi:ketosteroid isomerase-like protein
MPFFPGWELAGPELRMSGKRRKVALRKPRHLVSAVLALALLPITPRPVQAQAPDAEKELFKTVESLDAGLFNAVNHCDVEKVRDYFAEDAVFLHDKVPPLVGRGAIVDSIKNNLCGKVVRELVTGTLEVHSLKDYGAVEIGMHRFLHPFSQDQGVVGEAKFIHVWQLKGGTWRITQVISYDHHLAQ